MTGPLIIKLDELTSAMEDHSSEIVYYLDLETGEILPVIEETRSQLQEILRDAGIEINTAPDDLDLFAILREHGLDDDECEILAEAYDTANDPDRYLQIPRISSGESFKIMEDFVETISDIRWRDHLRSTLRDKSPFRKFKVSLSGNPGLREAWFKYKDEITAKRANDWLSSQTFEWVEGRD